jgi:alpha-L-rhamnosidase
MPVPVTAKDFPEIRWQGHWLWVPEEPVVPSGQFAGSIDPRAKETHGLFRKVFSLDYVPERVPARISADSRYALFVNGQEVGRGPIRSQFRRLHYDLYDLAPYLRAGANVVAVYVKYYGTEKAFWMPATPNRTLGKSGVMVFEAALGEAGWLLSDATWKAHKAGAWDYGGDDSGDLVTHGIPVEIFDARRFAHSWRDNDFDDRTWGAAQVVRAMHPGTYRSQPPTSPYGPLYPRPIAQLGGALQAPETTHIEILAGQVDQSVADPVTRVEQAMGSARNSPALAADLPVSLDLLPGGSALLTVDMGRIVSGVVEFAIEAPAGTILDLSYAEEQQRGGSAFGRMRAGSRYVARGEHDHFRLFDTIGFRYAYVLVHGTAKSVTIRHFAVQEYLYPWQDGATFSCSDEALERIFAAGLRTVQLCSVDAFVDCPTREQRAWVGDGVVHQMVHLATNSDWRLAWRYVELGNSPRSDGILPMFVVSLMELTGSYTIPDWSLHWVHGVYNLYRFSGDREAITALLPTVARILRWYAPYQTADGLLKDVTEMNLVDWSSVSTSDTSSLLTALWARGLREFAEMAGWLEENSSQRWAEALYARAKAGFEVFWDEARGSYIDHIVDGVRQPEMSQIAGALAIVSRLAPHERWGQIVDTITDPARLLVRSWAGGGQDQEKFEKQMRGIYEIDWDAEREIVSAMPFMSYVVHDAVALAGRAKRLPDLYLRWSQFLADGYDTIGENWGNGTHAHGWSCTPTRDMIFYTLGVTPAEPGYAKARVAPRLGRLPWVRGSVPTPHGHIVVEVAGDQVAVESPVPVVLDLEGQQPRALEAGRHEVRMRPS